MRRLLSASCLLLVGVSLWAETDSIESLVERSPFLPHGYRKSEPPREQTSRAPVAAAASRFELIGVVAKDGEVTVSLRRRGEKRGTWLAPGESIEDVKFIQFHLVRREAVVETGGRRETIPLKAPTVTGEIPAVIPPPPGRGGFPTSSSAAPKPQDDGNSSVKIPVRRRVIVPQK
ncbi:hypothetical protein [Puniceicoccus vermicola]|uniref:Type II secretion system protein GspC N-terminal domain-containing protein n=1 Tax=Puniceicoccus vermicola TaxID=388746 RepID=A0A7X1B035_9BACT|nr:hypothetical protein [Puniceicoccus vermicola]MBC2603104.1 hypothetical protein [Puniceicoccus vermicola]